MRLGLVRFFLVALASTPGPFVMAKDCSTVSRGKELKQMITKSNVLVALIKEESDTKELCERLQQTPEARVQDLEVVTVEDHNLQRKVWESSRPAPDGLLHRVWYTVESYVPVLKKLRGTPSTAATSVQVPAFVLFLQGADSYDKAEGLRYTGDDVSADAVTTFLAMWLKTKKLGSFVYSLGTYDLIASQTMTWVKDYSTQGWLPRLWVHGVGRMTRFLVQPASMPFEAQLAQMYVNSAVKVLEHGPEYPQTQIDRLERMLGDDDSKISPLKREELSQRMFIWRKFAEPTEVSKEDLYKFLGRLLLNLCSVVAMAVMIPMLLFTKEEYEEEYEEGEEEDGAEEGEEPQEDDEGKESNGDAANGDEDTPTDADTATMTKEEKRAAAIQRAKQSMEADKKKVEAVKAKKQEGRF